MYYIILYNIIYSVSVTLHAKKKVVLYYIYSACVTLCDDLRKCIE